MSTKKGFVRKVFGQGKDSYEIEMAVIAKSNVDHKEEFRFRFKGGQWEDGMPAVHRLTGGLGGLLPEGFGLQEIDECWKQIGL